MTVKFKVILLLAIVAAAITAAFSAGPVAQDPAYHRFADQRVLFSIPNFWNVTTNAAFVVVGGMGVLLLRKGGPPGGLAGLREVYAAFFLGITATGLCSAYYHLDPGNGTLVGDRLAMTVSFTAFFCAVAGERISVNTGRTLFGPLLILGIASVLYWHSTEARGAGDLRLYGVVQFLPLLLIPLILILYRSGPAPAWYIWGVIGCYVLAKIAETLDGAVYQATGVLSGHSLKHLFAAGGAYLFYEALRRRKYY